MTTEKIKLEPDERILMQVRKHWFVLLLQVVSVVVAALLPLGLIFVVQSFPGYTADTLTPYGPALTAFYAAWLLCMWMTLFSIWTNYYLDVWTITNKRLIAVNQRGFFVRTIASFRLERLQDVIVEVNGMIPTLLDYGSIELQTAGIEEHFKTTGLPSPGDIKTTILSSADTLLKAGGIDPKTAL